MGWHAAVVYALVGEVTDDDGLDPTRSPGGSAPTDAAGSPDPSAITATLTARPGGLERLRAEIAARRRAGQSWPYPIPAELRDGLGAAQLLAVVAELRRTLDLDPPVRPVLSDRPPDADERRLLADVPPHHGH